MDFKTLITIALTVISSAYGLSASAQQQYCFGKKTWLKYIDAPDVRATMGKTYSACGLGWGGKAGITLGFGDSDEDSGFMFIVGADVGQSHAIEEDLALYNIVYSTKVDHKTVENSARINAGAAGHVSNWMATFTGGIGAYSATTTSTTNYKYNGTDKTPPLPEIPQNFNTTSSTDGIFYTVDITLSMPIISVTDKGSINIKLGSEYAWAKDDTKHLGFVTHLGVTYVFFTSSRSR